MNISSQFSLNVSQSKRAKNCVNKSSDGFVQHERKSRAENDVIIMFLHGIVAPPRAELRGWSP